MNDNRNKPISSEEYKRVTEALYNQNLELARLYKKVDHLNSELERANARLRELDELKSQFLSFASHQIRAPLTAIQGYTSMILEGDFGEVPKKVKEAVGTADESARGLVKIVNEFLDVSRIEQGGMKYDYSDFNLRGLVEEVVKELRPNVEEKRLSLEFSAEQGNYQIHADQGKIKQVIENLIDNSIKYTEKGGIKISLRQTTDDQRRSKIQISISDTGIGIEKEDISRLFSMFSRAKDAHRTNVIGTGLGLYVAKQMVEAHKGKIWVESDGKGRGSTFYIELPAKL